MEIYPVVAVALDYLCDFLSVHINKLVEVLNEQVPAYSVATCNGHFSLEFIDSCKVSELIENEIHPVRQTVSTGFRIGNELVVLLSDNKRNNGVISGFLVWENKEKSLLRLLSYVVK